MTLTNLNDKTLLVVGLGLIGGSFAMACKNHGSVGRVIGYDRDAESLKGAMARKLVDHAESDLMAAVQAADIIFIAVPILATRSILTLMQPHLKPGTVLTDAGSAKGMVVSDARAVLTVAQCARFVPGHPIAGAERSGVMAAKADLYVNHRIILTPMAETEQDAVAMVTQLWESIGSHIDIMAIDHHDDVLAATSHLPHLLAFNLVDTLAKNTENSEIFHYAAGGFRDFTRIAASDPTMWHDIFMANRKSVLLVMDQYLAELHQLRNAVAHADGDYMKSVFGNAKEARDHFSQILSDRQLKDE
jgi:prephenate dehydrogenase